MTRKPSSKKIIMIGIDGADWNLINPWIESGDLENFKEIVNEGVSTVLMSTIPPFTLPAWTSIFTGVNPGKHGIIDNLIRIGEKYQLPFSRYRKTPLLWSQLGSKNLRSIVVNDPVTYPPEHINGIMVTGFLTPPKSKNYTFPPEIRVEIDKASNGYIPELPFDYDKTVARNKDEGFRYIQSFAEKTSNATFHLMDNHDWDILNVTFTSTDRLQHFYWHDKRLLKTHYHWLDSVIGSMLNRASNENADVILLSDHGFASIDKSIYLNTCLVKEGFIQTKNSRLDRLMLGVGLNYENLMKLFRQLHFRKTILRISRILGISVPSKDSISTFGNSIARLRTASGLFMKQKTSRDYEDIRQRIIDCLITLKDGEKRVINRIYRPENILWGPYVSRAPDLIIMPENGYYLSTSIKEDIIGDPIQSSGLLRTGDHRMQGIFSAYGPNIKNSMELERNIQTWDIAPTILRMFDLPIPDYMDGQPKINL